MDSAGLAAIHAAFAVDIEWLQDGVAIQTSAIPFHAAGDDPIGVGLSVRQKGFEVRRADIAFKPQSGAEIEAEGVVWRVIDVIDYEEADAWRVMVERG